MEEAHGPWRRELLLAAHVCEHVDRGRVSRKCSSASTRASSSAVVVVLVLPGSLAQKSEGRGEQEASDSQNMTHRTCCEKSLNKPLASSPNTCIVRLPLHQRLLACGRQRQGGEEGEREKSGEQRDKRRVRSTVTSRLTTLETSEKVGVTMPTENGCRQTETADEFTSSVRRESSGESSGPLGPAMPRDSFVAAAVSLAVAAAASCAAAWLA
jgi:hypothetical protein